MEWSPWRFLSPISFPPKEMGSPAGEMPPSCPRPARRRNSPSFCPHPARRRGFFKPLRIRRLWLRVVPLSRRLRRRSVEWLASPQAALFADSPGSSFSNRSKRFDLNRTWPGICRRVCRARVPCSPGERRNPRALLLQQRCEPFRRKRTRAAAPLRSPGITRDEGRRTKIGRDHGLPRAPFHAKRGDGFRLPENVRYCAVSP